MKTPSFQQLIPALLLSFSIAASAQGKTQIFKPTKRQVQSVMSLSEAQRQARLQHARELMGKHYSKSSVKSGEKISKINAQIYRWTKERLPKKFKSQYRKIAQAIIDNSVKHEFDPVFVLSVIQGESSFNPHMIGNLDEIGLMQLRPGTAEWITSKLKLKYKGGESLYDPVENIRIGTAYMAYLRGRFDSHAQLYLSAYNMGQGNVHKLIDRKEWPTFYANHVMKKYLQFYASM